MNFHDLFESYNKLNSFEKYILRTCTYLPPRSSFKLSELHDYHSLSWYIQNFKTAFGADFDQLIKGKRVLDFGCGFGGYVLAMGALSAFEAVGVEISDIVDQGIRRSQELGLNNVNFVKGSSHIIPDNSFDLVISHDAFEHFDNPTEILKEMIRLVKPGGYVLVKFGPTWLSPWGKHMNGTFRKDRPWIHVFLPEKSIMRVHSVYHNEKIMLEKYYQRPGGLNKMTVKRAKEIIGSLRNVQLDCFDVHMEFNLSWLRFIPVINELMSNWVYFKIKKMNN